MDTQEVLGRSQETDVAKVAGGLVIAAVAALILLRKMSVAISI